MTVLHDPYPPRHYRVLRQTPVPADGLRLSVIVPSFDTAPYVRDTLGSLFAQTVRDLEIIVVDDGSRDDSLTVLAGIDDPRLTVVAQTNRGLAGARNTGLLLARAPHIGFCDADDLWSADKAAKHLAVLDTEPRVGLTFSYSAYLDAAGRPTGQFLISRRRAPSARDIIRRNHIGNGSTVVMRTELFRLCGLFDETLGSCEDFELWVRAAACTPYTVRLLPEALTGYRVRPGSMSTTYDDFLRGYARALERFRGYVPGFTDREADRSFAECLRIASRKAFSHGDIARSRTLFVAALRHAPGLPLQDLRALGMLGLHLTALALPPGFQTRVHRSLHGALRQAFRTMPALRQQKGALSLWSGGGHLARHAAGGGALRAPDGQAARPTAGAAPMPNRSPIPARLGVPRLGVEPERGAAGRAPRGDDPRVVRRATIPAERVRLSVVVPCYNVGQLGVDAIASLLAQTVADLEIVAVDDGSTDDTLRRLVAIDDPRLTCLTQANRGLAGARNTGVRHARAGLIGFCDGDDLWMPDKAFKHLALMESDPRVMLTFSYSAYLDESGTPTGQVLVTRCRQPTLTDLLRRNVIGNGSTPIVRRVAFERAGLFDETLESCEDIEMWVRIAVFAGGIFRLVPEPLTGYRVRAASLMHAFARCVASGQLYAQRVQSYLPGYGPRAARRTVAEHLRILSRKAFDAGQIGLSRRLFVAALQHHPTLLVRDLRAFAMGSLHLLALFLPARARTAPYRLGRRLTKAAYARRFRPAAVR